MSAHLNACSPIRVRQEVPPSVEDDDMAPHSDAAFTRLAEKVASLGATMDGWQTLLAEQDKAQRQRDDAQRQREEDRSTQIRDAFAMVDGRLGQLGDRMERAEERNANLIAASEERQTTRIIQAVTPVSAQVAAIQAQMLALQQQSAARGGQERLIGPVGMALLATVLSSAAAVAGFALSRLK